MAIAEKLLSPFKREYWIQDEDVRKAVGRLPERDAVRQARLSAIALENDREQMRTDLMRKVRENREEADRLNAMLDELDALRVLETAT